MTYACADRARVYFRARGRGSPLFLIEPRPVGRNTWHPLLRERPRRSRTLTHTGRLRYFRARVTPAESRMAARLTWTIRSCAARSLHPGTEVRDG